MPKQCASGVVRMSLGPTKPPGTAGGSDRPAGANMAGGGLRDKFQTPSFGLPLSHEGTYITHLAFFWKQSADSIVLPRIGNNSASQLFSIQVGPEV